ncbi:prolipoprotein diacylglyceryl transferase [Nocardioidaceae bacterium]|nr:prolipoprotein diacylglyceryl transferase [Nocardioidaceae bacterium]
MTGLLAAGSALVPASIPSPDQGVWYLGPVPLRAYALCIIAGVVAGVVLGERRWKARGGEAGQIQDLALWAVPFGLVGGRLYHVITDWRLYFGEGQQPIRALYVWEGGLGIWGAVILGTIGTIIGARRMGLQIRPLADALAPSLLLGQAIGRWGNYFNSELFGRPTDLPWALEIDPAFRPDGYADVATFHPTFLYESLWGLAGVALLLFLDRGQRVGGGRLFAAYVMIYTAGRAWIEYLRIDDVQLADVFGLRLNVWTSLVFFALALAYVVLTRRRDRAEVAERPRSAAKETREPATESTSEERGSKRGGPRPN